MSGFKGRRFEGEVVLWAVRWYCRYGVSYRDLEQMMGERGVLVDHSTIYRWMQRYAPEMEKRLRWQRRVVRATRSCRAGHPRATPSSSGAWRRLIATFALAGVVPRVEIGRS